MSSRRSRATALGAAAGAASAAVVVGVVVLARDDGHQDQPVAMVTAPATIMEAISPQERLAWPPPVLEDPVVLEVTEEKTTFYLEDGQDYLVRLPADAPLVARGGLTLSGGEDIVLIGGEIRVPDGLEEGNDRRGLYLKEQTGTVHVEGVRLSGPLNEGINLGQPHGATVQLENVVVDEVRGSRATHHADLLQTWAGPARLRVDGLTGRTDYQGLFLDPMDYGPEEPEEFDLRRLRVSGIDRHGYMLWAPEDADYLSVTDSEVSLEWDRGRGYTFMPEGSWDDVAVVDQLSGGMPAGEPGVGYVSPGYATAP